MSSLISVLQCSRKQRLLYNIKVYVPSSFQEGRLFSDEIIIESLFKLLTIWVMFNLC